MKNKQSPKRQTNKDKYCRYNAIFSTFFLMHLVHKDTEWPLGFQELQLYMSPNNNPTLSYKRQFQNMPKKRLDLL
jgi:hypothetical protein